MILAQKNEQDPNYKNEQEKWLKAANLMEPVSKSVSQALSQTPPNKKSIKQNSKSQPKQDNWMKQKPDPFKDAREALTTDNEQEFQYIDIPAPSLKSRSQKQPKLERKNENPSRKQRQKP
jgi:hypothetical protein